MAVELEGRIRLGDLEKVTGTEEVMFGSVSSSVSMAEEIEEKIGDLEKSSEIEEIRFDSSSVLLQMAEEIEGRIRLGDLEKVSETEEMKIDSSSFLMAEEMEGGSRELEKVSVMEEIRFDCSSALPMAEEVEGRSSALLMAEELEGRPGDLEKTSETEEMKFESSSALLMAGELEGRSGDLENASETEEMKLNISSSPLLMAEELEGRSRELEKVTGIEEKKFDSSSSVPMVEELEERSGDLEKVSETEEKKIDSPFSLSMAEEFDGGSRELKIASEMEQIRSLSPAHLVVGEVEGGSENFDEASETKEMKGDQSSSIPIAEGIKGRSENLEEASKMEAMKVDCSSPLSMEEELVGSSGNLCKVSEAKEVKVDSSYSLSIAEVFEGRTENMEKTFETESMKVDYSSSLSTEEELAGGSGDLDKASGTKEMKASSSSPPLVVEELEGRSGYVEKSSEMEEMKVDLVSSHSIEVVFPAEDVIETLLDYLVEPMLPLKSYSSLARDHSSLPQQKAIAKQMHAVVLLYNYYHRKQFPQLEFLNFESFCKVFVNVKPSLSVHIKFIERCKPGSNKSEKLLSLTEKAIMDACNVSLGLDALTGAPSMNEWPVSKVVIFLIDNLKKSCLLRFSSLTQGVWSLIEKTIDGFVDELDHRLDNIYSNNKKQTTKMPMASKLNADEMSFRKLAFSAVKEATGIDQKHLRVLERHTVPSLGAEKTCVCFYLIRCTNPVNQALIQVPIEDALNSLRGPVVTKEFGSYSISSVVEYFHLLPYTGILSNWLSRADQESLDIDGAPITGSSPIKYNEHRDESDEILGDRTNDNLNEGEKGRQSRTVTNQDKVSFNYLENKMKSFAGGIRVGRKMRSAAEGDSVAKKMRTSLEDALRIGKSAPSYKVTEPRNVGRRKAPAAYIGGRSPKDRVGHGRYGGIETGQCFNKETLDQSLLEKKGKETLVDKGLNVENEVEKVIESTSDNVGGANDNCNIGFSCQDAIRTGDRSVFPSMFDAQNRVPPRTTASSTKNEYIQAAKEVLLVKRNELARQQRLLQDEIALCENNLQTVSSGDDYLMLKMDSIIEICNIASQRVTSQTHKESHQNFGAGSAPSLQAIQGSCQELDAMCCKEKWMLPRYTVFPAEGEFISTVTVQGVSFQCAGNGDLKANPLEARESAAKNILTKLRSMVKGSRQGKQN